MKVSYIGHGIENLSSKERKVVRNKPTLPSFTPDQVRHFQTLFRFLNDKDRDILYLIFVTKKKQNAVKHILDRSQPSIHYDIKRIRRRLQFICYLNSIFDLFLFFLEDRAASYGEFVQKILVLMFYTSSFTTTSEILGEEQMRIRYRYDRTLEQMAENGDWDMYELFLTIRNNLNIIRRVYRKREGCEII